MGWASNYIDELLQGRSIKFRPRGNSMTGRIDSGDLVEVVPITNSPAKNDIVLCKVNGNQFLHLVTAVRGNQFQISNNHGHVNGWTTLDKIYGVVISVSA